MIELSWLVIALVALVITIDNLRRAHIALVAVEEEDTSMNGTEKALIEARVLVARANVRREAIRVVVCAGLALITVPSLQRPGDVPISPFILMLMLIPVGMALNSYLDRKERLDIERLVAENGH